MEHINQYVVIKEFSMDGSIFRPGMEFLILENHWEHYSFVSCQFKENLIEVCGQGHDCSGRGKMGHCWHIRTRYIKNYCRPFQFPDWKV